MRTHTMLRRTVVPALSGLVLLAACQQLKELVQEELGPTPDAGAPPPGQQGQTGPQRPDSTSLPPAPPAVMMIYCGPATGADLISRGFYVTNYRAKNLQRVDMFLSSNVVGTYGLKLIARLNSYDGPVIGTSVARVSLAGDVASRTSAGFAFPSPSVPAGSTVAFVLALGDGPKGGAVYYAVTGDTQCPVIQTNDTAPPLSTMRRKGVGVRILGGIS